MNAQPPLLPRRPTNSIPDPDDIPDEPPPAYEPTPSSNNEQTLEYGPRRPYQQPIASPPPLPTFSPPPHQPPQRTPSRSHRYQHPSQTNIQYQPYQYPQQIRQNGGHLPPPTFPFWNGSNLTPAQTGFIEGPSLATFGTQPPPSFQSPHGAPPSHPSASSNTSTYQPPTPVPPLPSRGYPSYSPTLTPTPGQPLLYNNQLLVYPVGKEQCYKCQNTGYKPFDYGTGYKGDDPSHPCRKCWQKFGKAYTSILKHSHQPTAPSNYQRPLRRLETPGQNQQYGARAPPVFTTQRPHIDVLGNTLVVRPGDPRIGGVLCRACGGDGLQMGPFIFDEVSCNRCRGTGRVF
ncbi:hypothetical protein JCM5353_000874 [Sporobolomyces roseus]